MYNDILEFNGEWRAYQMKVLNHFHEYIQDHRVHIVAAPGSGKTTLGIEFIKKLGEPAIVFVPTITIREQWIERIKTAFLKTGINADDYLSQDLKNLKLITITTYQSLHSAITHFQGMIVEGDEDSIKQEEVDYHDFDFFQAIGDAKIKTMCLDECHHLRNEWWKSLETFKKTVSLEYTVSLTATPPYDSSLSMWSRYIDICGEIDEEISIPELVKEGSLCPHQDYVYFNYPTQEEKKEIDHFKNRSQETLTRIMNDYEFERIIQTHISLCQQADLDSLLEKPEYLASILIYLENKKLSYPQIYQDILGFKNLESMNEKWMEILLQGLLFDDSSSYRMDHIYQENFMKDLKANGLIQNNKVCFQVSPAIQKMLVKSAGKCDSIKDIVFHEYKCLKDSLKLLILTDYIKKEYEKYVGDETKSAHSLGVLPFFEMLRRENKKRNENILLSVLCGSMVIIPVLAKQKMIELSKGVCELSFARIGQIDEYIKVDVKGSRNSLTALVTELFAQGYIHVLIGTKSLLGEGWDSPCVNTLILASFVGSFMLSNQMRGRAIRTLQNHPEKTSHIWHLVCVNDFKQQLKSNEIGLGEDFETLYRRMDNFLGLHYQRDTIENGIERLSAITYPISKANIGKINQKMLKLSSHRHDLKERWDKSLAIYDKIEVVEENHLKDEMITAVVLFDAIRTLIIMLICFIIAGIFLASLIQWNPFVYLYITLYLALVLFGVSTLIKKIFTFANPLGRLKAFGEGIYSALRKSGLLESLNSAVEFETYVNIYGIYLIGGTGHDKNLFAKCVDEFFEPIDNQRYILYNKRRKNKMDGYFVVPEAFAKRKEDAIVFAENMRPFIGRYEIIYTRNIEVCKILLRGRIKALSNRQERCITRKKVKGALE